MLEIVLGALAVFVASFFGGALGFGYALVATPALLAIGLNLRFVVTANLALALTTRVTVAYRLRKHVRRRRAAALIGASIPGTWLGTEVLARVDEQVTKGVAGIVLMVAAVLLLRSLSAPMARPLVAGPLAAGFVGGLLGSATSLTGIVPALLLVRERVAPRGFIADMALYLVISNGIALGVLAVAGVFAPAAIFPGLVVWLPGVLAGTWLGTRSGTRLPEAAFHRLVLAIVFVAGAATAAFALGGN